jgi:acetoacetate decarboxylase
MVVPFLTDRDSLAAHLPPPFEVGEEPIVTVLYACNRQVDWLAGHGYNMIGVSASVVFKGDVDELAGSFTLVMWENLADPILTGRELQGIPKLYADIPDHSVVGGTWRANAGHFGHSIVDLAIKNLEPVTAEEIEQAAADQAGADHPMGWRYLPGISGFGTSVSEPTVFPSESTFTEVSVGHGTIDWSALTWEQNPTQFHIVNALADLPVLEYRPALVTKGSTNLVLADRLPRAIR